MCNTCGSYQLYLMVTSGKPYCYSGDIPCLTCKRFSIIKDNYTSCNISDQYLSSDE